MPLFRSTLSGPVRAALWMTFAAVFFAFLSTVVRHLSTELHPFVIAFFRSLFLLILMTIWMGPRLRKMRTRQWRMHLWRAANGTVSLSMLFYAFAHMPIGDVTALTFTSPLFATAGAALFLGETVRRRRWVATAIGFVGSLLIIRPGFQHLDPALFAALISAVGIAATMLLIRTLALSESSHSQVFYAALLMTPMTGIGALFFWTTPTGTQWFWLVLAGTLALCIQQGLARAFAAAEASVVLPFDFLRLLATFVAGFYFLSETPDLLTMIGGGIILAATIYIARREGRAAKFRVGDQA